MVPRNIYIVGAQCTGKTTLVNDLQQRFLDNNGLFDGEATASSGPEIIKETARTVLQVHRFTANDITSSPTRALALQKLILQAQQEAETFALSRKEWFISDRSGADPIVYARKYVGDEAATDLVNSSTWITLKKRMNQSVVVVCEAGADWLIDDGVRLMPKDVEEWVALHHIFCRCLDEWGVNYKVLPSSITKHEERVEFVLASWRS